MWAEDLNRQFFKEDIQMANKDIQMAQEKMINIINFIRKVKIKTTMRYHFTLVKVAIMKKSINNKCKRGYREKEIFLYCWWEC